MMRVAGELERRRDRRRSPATLALGAKPAQVFTDGVFVARPAPVAFLGLPGNGYRGGG